MATKFRKKPIVVEAIQWVGTNYDDVCLFVMRGQLPRNVTNFQVFIPTLEGEMCANNADWIVKGIKGECYPVKSEIFAATYEPAEAAHPPSELGRQPSSFVVDGSNPELCNKLNPDNDDLMCIAAKGHAGEHKYIVTGTRVYGDPSERVKGLRDKLSDTFNRAGWLRHQSDEFADLVLPLLTDALAALEDDALDRGWQRALEIVDKIPAAERDKAITGLKLISLRRPTAAEIKRGQELAKELGLEERLSRTKTGAEG